MRERSSIWDIATVGLLAILILINGIMLLQNDRSYTRINELTEAVAKIDTGGRGPSTSNGGSDHGGNHGQTTVEKNDPIVAIKGGTLR